MGRELTLALNGLKYACTTFFFFPSCAVRPNDIPHPDDLSSLFRAFMSGINWRLPCLTPLMDNHFIFLDYIVYTPNDPNQNEYGKHDACAVLTTAVGAILLTTPRSILSHDWHCLTFDPFHDQLRWQDACYKQWLWCQPTKYQSAFQRFFLSWQNWTQCTFIAFDLV